MNIIDMWLYRGVNSGNATAVGIGTAPDLTIGYFIVNGFMIGTTYRTITFQSESSTEGILFFQPVVKIYFPISDKFLLNAKGFFGLVRERYILDSDTYTRIRFGGGGACTYMLLPSLGVSIGGEFKVFPNRKVSGTTIDNTSYNVINIFIGLTAYF